jgi:hypothetical protein
MASDVGVFRSEFLPKNRTSASEYIKVNYVYQKNSLPGTGYDR